MEYIFKFIFKTILGTNIRITNSKEDFIQSKEAKLNYSDERFDNELFIKPHSLLFETSVFFQEVSYHDFYEYRGLFLTGNVSDLSFDPFAASFFLITRYEEITDDVRDEHDRFLPSHSIAYKYNFLEEPVIDQWAFLLKKKILAKYPSVEFNERKFQFISTLDVDQAFAFKNREAFRIIGSFIRCVINLDFTELTRQIAVYSGGSKDPFDTFDYIEEIHKKYNVKPNIFILFGRYGKYDKNNPVYNTEFRELVRYLSQFTEIGFHPSYTSNFDIIQLKNELKNLARVSNKWIKFSRQHFLKLKLPETYYNLTKTGIHQDFSMGYARECGFRAGTCTPFEFFDIHKNEEIDMTVYPFQVMDRSLVKYLKLSPKEAASKIELIVSKIKEVDGTFISLWHNDALGNYKEWRGWKNVFKKMFEIVYA